MTTSLSPPPIRNGLSVDVDDYFQVQAFADAIPRTDWERCPSRVEASTDRILALFDQAGVHATFFTRGWVAERQPKPAIFYFHPWEIDAAQPRITNCSRLSRFRHYVNLSATTARISRLLHDFAWDRMDRVFSDSLTLATHVQ